LKIFQNPKPGIYFRNLSKTLILNFFKKPETSLKKEIKPMSFFIKNVDTLARCKIKIKIGGWGGELSPM
jgi:hypothetical protein